MNERESNEISNEISNKRRVIRELQGKKILETWQKTMILSLEKEIEVMEKEMETRKRS